MKQIKKKNWTIIIFSTITLILMVYNISIDAKNRKIEILTWTMTIIVYLYLVWTSYQNIKLKEESKNNEFKSEL